MKIIKAQECKLVGVESFQDEPYMVFRTKYGDLEWIKECKFIRFDGNEVYILRIVNGKIQATPTYATKLKSYKMDYSKMELSQNYNVSI